MMIWRGLSAKTIVAAAEAIAQRKSSGLPRRGRELQPAASRDVIKAIKAVESSPDRYAAE